MTTQQDEVIIGALRALEDTGGHDAAPVTQLLKRGRSARTRRIGALSGAGLGLIGLAAALATAASPGPGSQPGSRAQHDSLALAAQTTAAASYHIKITVPAPDFLSVSGTVRPTSLVIDGAYDPANGNGYLDQVSTSSWARAMPEISAGGTCYVKLPIGRVKGGGAQWHSTAGSCFDVGNLGTVDSWIGNPGGLLKQLATDGSAKLVGRSGSGVGEVDVWSYTYTGPAAPGGRLILTYTGTATVDAATQHVTQLTVHTLTSGQELSANDPATTYDFSDFGAPVSVTAPSTAQVSGSSS